MVWINQVPERKTAKYRIHLDVHGSSIEDLQAIGASVIDDEPFPWVVMADPDGGEFCLFIRKTPPEYRLYEVVIDLCRSQGHIKMVGHRDRRAAVG